MKKAEAHRDGANGTLGVEHARFRSELVELLAERAASAELVRAQRVAISNKDVTHRVEAEAARTRERQLKQALNDAVERIAAMEEQHTVVDALREAHAAKILIHAEEEVLAAARIHALEVEIEASRTTPHTRIAPPCTEATTASADSGAMRTIFNDAVRRTEETALRVESLASRVATQRGASATQLNSALAALETIRQQGARRAFEASERATRTSALARDAKRDARDVLRLAADLAATTRLSEARLCDITRLEARLDMQSAGIAARDARLLQTGTLLREALAELRAHEIALEALERHRCEANELVERSRSEVVELRSTSASALARARVAEVRREAAEVQLAQFAAAAALTAAPAPSQLGVSPPASAPPALESGAPAAVAAPPAVLVEQLTAPPPRATGAPLRGDGAATAGRASTGSCACSCGEADAGLMVTCCACRRAFHSDCSRLSGDKLAMLAMGSSGVDFTCAPCILRAIETDEKEEEAGKGGGRADESEGEAPKLKKRKV